MTIKEYIARMQGQKRVERFAARVGVSVKTVYSWINEERYPGRKNRRRIHVETGGAVTRKDMDMGG